KLRKIPSLIQNRVTQLIPMQPRPAALEPKKGRKLSGNIEKRERLVKVERKKMVSKNLSENRDQGVMKGKKNISKIIQKNTNDSLPNNLKEIWEGPQNIDFADLPTSRLAKRSSEID